MLKPDMEDKILINLEGLLNTNKAMMIRIEALEAKFSALPLIAVVPNVAVITPEHPCLPDKEEQPADTSSAQVINSVQHQKAIDSAQRSPFRDMVPYLSLTEAEQLKATD